MLKSLRKKITDLISEIGDIQLVVVTKNQPKEILEELLLMPEVKHLGENRWQKFKERFLPDLYKKFKEKDVQFHFIGHLQTNKVDEVVKYFDVIQSVDSMKLIKKIDEEAKKNEKIQKILLEVNISEDPNKYGFSIEDIPEGVIYGSIYPNIHIEGFMTILKENLTQEEQLKYFKKLHAFTDTFNLPIVSMGMSGDYKTAIEAGTNMIRVGSAIFKEL